MTPTGAKANLEEFTVKPSNTKLFASALLLLLTGFASAQSVDIEVVNGETREKKTYTGGSSDFRVPVDFVQGWSHCTSKKMRTGKTIRDFARAELYCFSNNGTVQSISCVTFRGNSEATATDLFGGQFKFAETGGVTAASWAGILMTCKY